MSDLVMLAAWVLLAANVISLAYEVWRATAKSGTSRHDSMRVLLTQGTFIYGVAAVVLVLMFLGTAGSAWIGLVFVLISIAVSVFYYNPVVMPERDPGLIDWVEDLVFTGLLFVAAAFLILDVAGRTLS
ncbi:MAG TPA: hypothetical protein VLB67_16105 [Acidimicrobiia bacterium]|nr:hypothetical protein [Acidimicrobiia bacterium]